MAVEKGDLERGEKSLAKIARTAGIAVLAVGTAAAVAAFVVRNQIDRHQRDLFSPRPIRRLAALGHMSGNEATVRSVQLLRDYVAWEPRNLLRKRGEAVLARMEAEVEDETLPA